MGFKLWGLGFKWFPKIRGYQGLYRDDGTQNGNYYLGFMASDIGGLWDTFLRVPIISIIVNWGLYWVP